MRIAFYLTILTGVVALAWWRGQRDERLAALTCLVGTALTVLTNHPLPQRYAEFETLGFMVDVAVLLSFIAIALRSDRFWPLWVAGLQLTATSVHLLKLINPDLMRFVFGAALAFWSYPILLLIAIGTLRTRVVEEWRTRLRDAA